MGEISFHTPTFAADAHRRTVRTMGPNPLTMLSTSSRPNVRLKLPHRRNVGSPSGLPSAEPEMRRHRSSRSWYASRAAGLRVIVTVVSSLFFPSPSPAVSPSTAGCEDGFGTRSLNEGSGSDARSAGSFPERAAATRLSSSPTRSNTNMKSWRRVADAVEATTGILEVERRWESSRACRTRQISTAWH